MPSGNFKTFCPHLHGKERFQRVLLCERISETAPDSHSPTWKCFKRKKKSEAAVFVSSYKLKPVLKHEYSANPTNVTHDVSFFFFSQSLFNRLASQNAHFSSPSMFSLKLAIAQGPKPQQILIFIGNIKVH